MFHATMCTHVCCLLCSCLLPPVLMSASAHFFAVCAAPLTNTVGLAPQTLGAWAAAPYLLGRPPSRQALASASTLLRATLGMARTCTSGRVSKATGTRCSSSSPLGTTGTRWAVCPAIACLVHFQAHRWQRLLVLEQLRERASYCHLAYNVCINLL